MAFSKLIKQHFTCMGNGIIDDPYLNYGTLQNILYTPMASHANKTTLWHAIQLTTGKMCFIVQNNASGTYTIIKHKNPLFTACMAIYTKWVQLAHNGNFYASTN